MGEAPRGPEVVEVYNGYAPPFDIAKLVRIALACVPSKYLVGLKTIVLTNYGALSRDKRRQKVRSRGRKVSMARARGAYHRAWSGGPAWIAIFVDHTIRNYPEPLLRIPFFRTMCFSDVLYHEIGHHIHHTTRPEFREPEDVADAWKKKLSKGLMRKRYWYALPILRPVARAYKFFSKRSENRRNDRGGET
jgi:hypothetical protein